MSRRLDQELVARGLAESRARAQALIVAGAVTVEGLPAAKPALKVEPTTGIVLTADPLPYVSRAALKLVHALAAFGLDPSGSTALDLGASTGGFCQVLLERGAREVWGVEVGHGQLAPALRAEPRLRLIEGLNARDLGPAHVPPPDFVTSDLSFISLAKALPPALSLATPGATLVALIKPQFEVGPAFVGKGGLVRDAEAIARVRAEVRAFLEASGWPVLGEDTSPIRGGDGNTEYLIAARKSA